MSPTAPPTIGRMSATITASETTTVNASPIEQDARLALATRLAIPMPADRLRGWLCTAVITLIAGFLRLWHVDFPKGKIFDEVYYPPEAHELLRQGYENNPGYMFIVHPPLGKWCIAIGEHFFGNNELGWRVPAAVAGSLSVLILIRVVRRMTRSTMLGCIAGLLLTLDGLSFVQSRVAILDIFLQFFVIIGFACLVLDRDWMRTRLAAGISGQSWSSPFSTSRPSARLASQFGKFDRFGPKIGPRPWRLTGGILLGLSCAVKWSGIYFLVGFAILSILWDRAARRSAGIEQKTRATAVRDFPGAIVSFGLAPLLAYLASWTGWFLGENSFDRHWADGHHSAWSFIPAGIRSLWHYHAEMLNFHTHLTSFHPYKSTPWSWIIDGRPVSYYYPSNVTGCGASQCVRHVLALGTPAIWWAFIPALVWMVWLIISRRDWRAGVVLMAFAAGWASWLIDTKRTMFIFYMTPLVPFLIIGIVLVLGDILGPARATISRRKWGLAAVSGYTALVVVNFWWLYPIFTGGLLTYDQWYSRMWFTSWI